MQHHCMAPTYLTHFSETDDVSEKDGDILNNVHQKWSEGIVLHLIEFVIVLMQRTWRTRERADWLID